MQNLYMIKDKAVGFTEVFIANNDFGAKRVIADAVNREGTGLNLHTEDMSLYKIATLNTDTGAVESTLEFVCECSALKKEQKTN